MKLLGFLDNTVYHPYFNDEEIEVNENIKVLSSFAHQSTKSETSIDVRISDKAGPGDMVLLAIVYKKKQELPKNYMKIIEVKTDDNLNVLFCYRIKQKHRTMRNVVNVCGKTFVSAIVIRGSDLIIDTGAMINTGRFDEVILASTPRVRTTQGGALVSFFIFNKPVEVEAKNQHTLLSESYDSMGYFAGISSTEGGISKRIKATHDSKKLNRIKDVSIALSIY